MTFLSKQRTRDSYFDKISTKSKSLNNSTRIVLDQFDIFCNSEYSHDSENVIQEFLALDGTQREESACDVYQSWINWSFKKGISPKTLKVYFSLLKSYLHYRGIKISEKDIKANVTLPKLIKEEKYPLSMDQIHDILKIASYSKKSLYLALLSSGMRIGEAVQIRKKDTSFSQGRLTVKIPARITKTKTGRTVYISKEATNAITPKRNKIKDDGLLWGTNSNYLTAVQADVKAFSKYVDSSPSKMNSKVLPKIDKQIDSDTYKKQNSEEEKISVAVDKPRHESKPKPSEYKSESATLVLSIVVGLFGIMGVGHLYIGKIRRGIIIMVIGFSLWTVVFIPFLFLGIGDEIEQSITADMEFLQYSGGLPQKDTSAVLIGFVIAIMAVSIGYLVLYIWQIFDSRKLCKRYNQHLEKEGKPLW
ncbi:MAG: site-specific integrase [Nitrosopumilus sp.]|nr:site-specific integrase [Nitrosopumilus sp.]MDH3736324.1 site-specific integrase [Nitrosopumilus sp.]MDH3833713.1 site-specific integrase [Nitrosopumilus sp.]